MPNFTYTHNWAGFQFRERAPGSPSFRFGREHSRSQRVFMTPWRTDATFSRDILQALLGYATIVTFITTPPSVKYVSRKTPWRDISFQPPADLFYADDVEVVGDVPKGKDINNSGLFDEAQVTVRYRVDDFFHFTDDEMKAYQSQLGLQSDYPDESTLLRNVRVHWQPAAKWQTLPSMQALRFNNATAANRHPVSTTQAVLLVEGELIVEWLGVPLNGIPSAAITACVGKTNAAPFGAISPILSRIFGPLGVDTGTMICQMPRIKKPWRQSTGHFVTDIGYVFRVFPKGANSFYFWDAPTGGGFTGPGFYPASRSGDGTDPLFTTADYTSLFKPE